MENRPVNQLAAILIRRSYTVAARFFISSWLGCWLLPIWKEWKRPGLPSEKKNDGPCVCICFWCWTTGLMYNKRAAIHQDDTWRTHAPAHVSSFLNFFYYTVRTTRVHAIWKEGKQQVRPMSPSSYLLNICPFYFWRHKHHREKCPLRINAVGAGVCAS